MTQPSRRTAGRTPAPRARTPAVPEPRTTPADGLDRLALIVEHDDLLELAYKVTWGTIELSSIMLGEPNDDGDFTPPVEDALARERNRIRDAHTDLRNAARAYALNS